MKRILLLLSLGLSLVYADDYTRANVAAKEALNDLDCDFDDCKKEPQVVEKVIVKEVIKEVPVEKVVVKEVIKEVPVEKVVEKVIIKEVPSEVEPQKQVVQKPKTTPKKEFVGDILYAKAYFDIHTKSQDPILGLIEYKNAKEFDQNHYIASVKKISESHFDVYIHGNIQIPNTITTEQVYVNVGPNYHYRYYNYWYKEIRYNDVETVQNAENFLADVKTDAQGRRYVAYKIKLHLENSSKLNYAERNVGIRDIHFKVAPKVRTFQDKFVDADIYIPAE